MDTDTHAVMTTQTAAYAPLIPVLDVSEEEWLIILNAMACQPSERRAAFGETLDMQAQRLPMMVEDWSEEAGGAHNLGSRIAALPRAFQFAILEVLERFWQPDILTAGETLGDKLGRLGVRLNKSAHERLEDERVKRRYAG